jgi:mono/diheme cytochrome c family protein
LINSQKTIALVALSVGCIFLLFQAFTPGSTGTVSSGNDTAVWPHAFGFGGRATAKEIRSMDISIRPDGRGLPVGSGTASKGREVYIQKCSACHGAQGKGGPYSVLVGAMGDTTKAKTIGNYWPYATTIFDYVRRAMPFNAPGSLSDNEVYGLTAYLLYENKIIDSNLVINSVSLPGVIMPAKKLFVPDDRAGGAEIK